MADNSTSGVTPQISSQTLAAADASIKNSATSEETNKTLTGVHSIIIDLEELQREYYEEATDYIDSATEFFDSILDSLVTLTESITDTNIENKKSADKKPKSISKQITIDQVIKYNDSSAAAAVLICNKLDALFGKNKKNEQSGGDDKLGSLLKAAGAGAGALLLIAGSMLLFAAGAALFDKVNWPAALAGVAFFAVFVAGTLAISLALRKETNNLKQFAKNVIMMTGALALFGVALWFISEVDKKLNWGAITKTLITFGLFVTGVTLLAKYVNSERNTFKDFAVGTVIMTGALVLFAGAMLFAGWAYEHIDFKAVGIITGAFLTFVLGVALLSKLANKEQGEFMKFGITVAIMTADLMLFAFALQEIQKVNLAENLGSTLGVLGLFFGFVIGLAAVATLANAQMAQFAIFAATTLLMIGSLMLFTLAIKLTSSVQLKDIGMAILVLGSMLLFTAAFSALGLGLSVAAPIILPGLGVALLVGAAMLGVVATFAGITKLLKTLTVEKESFNKLDSLEALIDKMANIDWHPVLMLKVAVKMAPAFAAIKEVESMVKALGTIAKLEIDQNKINSALGIAEGLIKSLGQYADSIQGIGLEAAMALKIALGGVTDSMMNITNIIDKIKSITPEEVQQATVSLQYIMSKLFLKGDDPINAPTLMDVLQSVPDMSKKAVQAVGALPDVTQALNNIADVILKVKDLSPEEVEGAVQSIMAMADCLANCSGFFKSIAENSSYGGFLGFGKKDTFNIVNEKMDSISQILTKIIDVFGNLGTVDPEGVLSISSLFEHISQIDKNFVKSSGYFADGLTYIAQAPIRDLISAFEGLNPSNLPLATFIVATKPVENVGKEFVEGAKFLQKGINHIASSKFDKLGEFKIIIDEINPQPFMRLAEAMDIFIKSASHLTSVNKELSRLNGHLNDVYNASKKFKNSFSIGSITSNAIDKAHSWLESFSKKTESKDSSMSGENSSYIVNYLADGNDITRQMLELLQKWEEQGVLIRSGEVQEAAPSPAKVPKS